MNIVYEQLNNIKKYVIYHWYIILHMLSTKKMKTIRILPSVYGLKKGILKKFWFLLCVRYRKLSHYLPVYVICLNWDHLKIVFSSSPLIESNGDYSIIFVQFMSFLSILRWCSPSSSFICLFFFLSALSLHDCIDL